jgi:hypothetical protein
VELGIGGWASSPPELLVPVEASKTAFKAFEPNPDPATAAVSLFVGQYWTISLFSTGTLEASKTVF